MTVDDMQAVVDQCLHPDYTFSVTVDKRGAIYLQASYMEKDTVTDLYEEQLTRRWFLNYEMSESEIVQTAFKCVMTSMEHRAREHFKFQNEPVFNPHFDVQALVEICRKGRFVHREVRK